MDPTRAAVIPLQQDTNFEDPEEHFLFALRNIPMLAGSGMMTNSGFYRKWSEHLWKVGCAHRDYLASLANADGFIHVDQLPKQQVVFQEAFRGPGHTYNAAARWVPVEMANEHPPVVKIPDLTKMTDQERWVLAYQQKRDGFTIPDAIMPPAAEVMDEGEIVDTEDTQEIDAEALQRELDETT